MPPLQMVDDIITASRCGNQVVTTNAAVNIFVKLKKLEMSVKKCARIHVSKSKCAECPEILVNKTLIKEAHKEKYLGDYITNSASASDTIKDRKSKGYGILGDIRAILEDIPLGNKRLEAGLTLREAWFLNGTLYNSEAWGEFTKADITELEVLDRKILRQCLGAHCKSPSEMLYLESSTLPISSVISVRRLCYLQNILKRHDSEIVKKIYTAQKNNPTPGDWIHRVGKDLETYQINMSEEAITNMAENEWKAYVKLRVRKTVFEDLREVQSGHIKVKDINFSCLKNPQKYLTSKLLNNKMRSLLYNLRSRSVKSIKDNFHKYYKGNVFCPLKCLQVDSQEHLLCCAKVISVLNDDQKTLLGRVKYDDIFGSVEDQAMVTGVFLFLLKIRTKLLETDQRLACEGNNTRPQS